LEVWAIAKWLWASLKLCDIPELSWSPWQNSGTLTTSSPDPAEDYRGLLLQESPKLLHRIHFRQRYMLGPFLPSVTTSWLKNSQAVLSNTHWLPAHTWKSPNGSSPCTARTKFLLFISSSPTGRLRSVTSSSKQAAPE
jgi:hypothetical protein